MVSGSGQWSVVSGQWSVVSGQWSEVNWQLRAPRASPFSAYDCSVIVDARRGHHSGVVQPQACLPRSPLVINSRGHHKIPVGYSAADVDTNRRQMAAYMNCGTDDERSDFFAFNDYSWCDSESSFQISDWDKKVENSTGYGLPLFLSEHGCIEGDRQFKVGCFSLLNRHE